MQRSGAAFRHTASGVHTSFLIKRLRRFIRLLLQQPAATPQKRSQYTFLPL